MLQSLGTEEAFWSYPCVMLFTGPTSCAGDKFKEDQQITAITGQKTKNTPHLEVNFPGEGRERKASERHIHALPGHPQRHLARCSENARMNEPKPWQIGTIHFFTVHGSFWKAAGSSVAMLANGTQIIYLDSFLPSFSGSSLWHSEIVQCVN